MGPEVVVDPGEKTTVDITLPVLNEARTLENNTHILVGSLALYDDYNWRITIVDNGSTDGSWDIAERIACTTSNVRAVRLERPGRGGALKAAWSSSTSDIVAYMDIDLSTSLDALTSLVDPIATGTADIVIGSRLAPESDVTRTIQRELISRIYNVIARAALSYPIRDAQCGFKAASRNVVSSIMPSIEDTSWFFDTELLVLAYRKGLRIKEVPVRWAEDADSRVRILKTSLDDLRGIWRLRARH